MRRLYLLFILITITFASCTKDATPVESTSKDVIIPLAVGNQWIHGVKKYDSLGTLINVQNKILQIARDSIINGEKVYIDELEEIVVNRPDGLWILNGGALGFEEQLLYKYPCNLHDTYDGGYTTYRGNERDVLTVTVDSVNETITVPSGTYSCIKYIWEGYFPSDGEKTYRWIFYASPRVGEILQEYYQYRPGIIEPILYQRDELAATFFR